MAARQFCQQSSYLGYVTEIIPEDGCFKLRIRSEDYSGNDLIYAYVNSEVWYRPLPNLGGSYANYGTPDGYDSSTAKPGDKLKLYLAVGALVLVEGIYFRDHLRNRIDVRTVYLLYDQQGKPISEKKGNLMFEEPRWWLDMISAQGNTWFNVFFSDGDVNFTRYRTELNELYQPKSSLQEVAVLSRLLYGYAVTYQMTGKEKYLTALREGVKYQRDTFRLVMPDGKAVLWASYYDGVNVHLPSKSGDDKDTIPLYEQIYALAGITMYYRITGDLEALKDILATVEAFDAYFLDKTKYGNYFSHLDPQSLSPHKESLGINHAKKNWNSVGDHIPAYLINLICALSGKPEFAGEMKQLHRMLIFLTEDIIAYFPQHDKPDGSRLVAERFYQDWTLDKEYSWQQDRGIIGHNLKIAWNLTRVAFYLESTIDEENLFPPNTKPKRMQLQKDCLELARELANAMDELGGIDKFRGGCFDAVERHPTNGYNLMFTWFSTKDFWQQEQGILCYLIQMGTTKYDANFEKYKELAAVMSAFYCAFFVDQDRGGIYFRVTDIGVPIMTGEYGDKGGHAKSGYHIFELCYLAHIYTMVYNNPNPFTLHFAPIVPADGKLHLAVSPDFLPKDAIDFHCKDTRVEIVGKGLPKPISRKLDDFILDVNLPKSLEGTTVNVQVTLQPKTTKRDHDAQHSKAPSHVPTKGKIGVVVESHYDELEVQYLQKRLPKEGFEMELISRLWEKDMLEFQGNECHDPIRVYKDIDAVKLEDYVAFFFISGYCMDRLRYQEAPEKGKPNNSPVVNLIRKIAKAKKTTATICHSLMAFNCAPEVMKTLKVTCSHNILDDVINAGGTVMYQPSGVGTLEVFEYEWMVSGKTSSEMEQTVDCLIHKLNKEHGWK